MARRLTLENALYLLLVFVPITILLEWVFHGSAVAIFICSALAIIPLAGLMGKATEALAAKVGTGLGGLLNATFGNAAELIIAIFALRAGLVDLVKASLTGSIIGNILLIFGLSALLGGIRFPHQKFNRTAGGLGSTMLILCASALVIPAVYHGITDGQGAEGSLSLEISVVLMVCYLMSLVFMLRTHDHLYVGEPQAEDEGGAGHGHPDWSSGRAFGVLLGSAAVIGLMSEILVGAVEEAAHTLGMTEIFIGVVVVALVGNAAEHSTAILVALRNKMDLAMQVAIGSSVQIALFVAPLLVLLSYLIAPAPMDLVFSSLEVVAVAISVIAISQIAADGETHWMEGVLLVGIYLVLAFAFYSLPG